MTLVELYFDRGVPSLRCGHLGCPGKVTHRILCHHGDFILLCDEHYPVFVELEREYYTGAGGRTT